MSTLLKYHESNFLKLNVSIMNVCRASQLFDSRHRLDQGDPQCEGRRNHKVSKRARLKIIYYYLRFLTLVCIDMALP